MPAPTGYEHLTPLLIELGRLRPDDPRRRTLRTEIITGYLPVAQHIARKHAYRGEDLDDLEQVAAVGLVYAVDRFRPVRGDEFLSFAVPTINGEVLRHYRDRTTPVRMPRRLQALQRTVTQTVDELSQRLGHIPDTGEIARELDLDRSTVADVLSARRKVQCTSLDEGAGDAGAAQRKEAVLAQVDPELDLAELRVVLAPLIEALPERERRILLLRYFGGLTQLEIATWIGCSQMHVSRLLTGILAGLRNRLTDGGAGGSRRTRRIIRTRAAVAARRARSRGPAKLRPPSPDRTLPNR